MPEGSKGLERGAGVERGIVRVTGWSSGVEGAFGRGDGAVDVEGSDGDVGFVLIVGGGFAASKRVDVGSAAVDRAAV